MTVKKKKRKKPTKNAALASAVQPRTLVAAVSGQGNFFVLIDGPSGNPPRMRIRDFSPTQAAACIAQVRVVDAFQFQPTGHHCQDGPICQRI